MPEACFNRTYEDFQPSFNWSKEEGENSLAIHLPGFKRDQLKVQIESHGCLKISGERFLGDNRWSRFRKDLLIPKKCNRNETKAWFANGVLYIKLPLAITQFATQDKATLKQQPPLPAPKQKILAEKKSKVNGGVTEQIQEKSNQASQQKSEEDDKKEMNGKDGINAASELGNDGKMIVSLEDQVTAPQKQTSCRLGMGIRFSWLKEERRRIMIASVATAALAIALALALGFYAKIIDFSNGQRLDVN